MDDPDWMNEFQTPTENVLMHLSSSSPSSSPSRERIVERESGTREDVPVSNGKQVSDDEDSPLISALQYSRVGKKGRKGLGGDISMSQEVEKSPAKLSAKVVRKGSVGAQEDDVDAEESPRSRGKNKRALEFEEEDDDYEYQAPSKVRKTSTSPQVKKEAPRSGRKGRRVSFSEEEGTPQLKKMETEVQLGDPIAMDEDDEEPISTLVRKKGNRPTAAAAIIVSPAVVADDFKLAVEPKKEPRGVFALASLRDPVGTAADGEDAILTQEEASQGETGEISEQKGKPRAYSNLPVVFAERVHRTKVLLECERDTLDLSGDMGAVGRFSVDPGQGNSEDELFLDLKGIIYKTTIVPSNTFFVVNVGHAEAKVEAIMNDFMQLRPDINQVEDETVVEGTLEGFAFDLDNDREPLSTPVTAAEPVDSDSDQDTKKKKKIPTKVQKQKKVAVKGSKGSRAKGAGKKGKGSNRRSRRTGTESRRKGKGATSKKPRAKAKVTTKRPSKTKPTAAKGVKSKKS